MPLPESDLVTTKTQHTVAFCRAKSGSICGMHALADGMSEVCNEF